MARALYFVIGCLMVALGVIGAFVPLMPTTIFLIIAAACFARSSPRLEAWLLNHPQFGPGLRDWRAHGAISKRAKLMACCGMTFGFIVFLIGARPSLPLAALVFVVLAGCAAYVVSRPASAGDVES